jgi:hypothetical protein
MFQCNMSQAESALNLGFRERNASRSNGGNFYSVAWTFHHLACLERLPESVIFERYRIVIL